MARSAYVFDHALAPSTRYDIVERAMSILEARTKEFDAIAFTGMSGAAIAPILAYALDKPLIVVRHKDACHHHSINKVEAPYESALLSCYGDRLRVLIVDDFESSGATMCYIRDQLVSWEPKVEIVGVYLYSAKHSQSAIFPTWNKDPFDDDKWNTRLVPPIEPNLVYPASKQQEGVKDVLCTIDNLYQDKSNENNVAPTELSVAD